MNKVKVLARCGAKGIIRYFDASLNFPFLVEYSAQTQVDFPVHEMVNVNHDGNYLESHCPHECDITHYYEGRTKIPWPKSFEEYGTLVSLIG